MSNRSFGSVYEDTSVIALLSTCSKRVQIALYRLVKHNKVKDNNVLCISFRSLGKFHYHTLESIIKWPVQKVEDLIEQLVLIGSLCYLYLAEILSFQDNEVQCQMS